MADRSPTVIARVQTFATFGGVRNWLFVRVETADGMHGWGEASTELWEGTVRAAVEELGARMIGLDAMAVERRWQEATRHGFWRGGIVLASAVAAIDQALWDIRGKRLGVPVHVLLGGPVRDRVDTYRHVAIYDPERTAADARALVESGVRVLKTGAWVSDSVLPEHERLGRAVERLSALRDAVGWDVDVLIDNHGRSRPDEAIRLLRALAPFRIRWIEEPIAPESPELVAPVAAVARDHGISVAFGERLFSRAEFRPALERGLVDVVQPDLCHAGGISEVTRIASLADTYRAVLAPHNPAGPVSTAASAQVALAVPSFSLLELCPDEPRRSEVSVEPWTLEGASLTVPDRPGLGIDLDVEALLDVPARPIAVPSSAYGADGSVMDV
ncbi:galactonate dehydratase [Herbiconiux sp. KACC 21604]|uniref:galactonate dehydratase n=1 Tax=unclassified Herbiconiux TaxID=2618217 RepID=UPI0014913727|nr:galactonate dehydratase [Herbiconiux sp. SALV-R1]QJU55225.1 galactonate dehydratase [Herbiconiux sp. SALV-R1]WPO86390.1 galactonate dehydratase [Herbiconiux sp. KACC 21604]